MKKNTKILLGIIFGLIFLVSAIKYGNLDRPLALLGDNFIQVPTFFYYECSPASAPVTSPVKNIVGGDSGWLACPSNTDSCAFTIQVYEKVEWYSAYRRLVYQICNSNGCQSQVIKDSTSILKDQKTGLPTLVTPYLTKDDQIYINYQYRPPLTFSWKNLDGASYYTTYKPFILWKVGMLSGGKTEYTSQEQGCVFPYSATGNLLDSVKNLINIKVGTQTSSSDRSLEPYKTRNFIEGYIPMSVENVNFVTYNGQQGYCLNRQIFAIAEVQTNSGVYKIVDSRFNTQLASSVTCCPNEREPSRVCNSNFQWENIDTAECSYFKPCAGANWMPYQSRQLIRYNCIGGKCVSETKPAECLTNTDCLGNPKGSSCDTYLYECVNVPSPVPGPGIPDAVKSSCDTCWGWLGNKIYDGYCVESFWDKIGITTAICLLFFVKMLAVLIIVILGTFWSQDFLYKKFKNMRKPKALSWIVSFVIMFAIGFVIYLVINSWIFWVASILSLVYLFIIKNFIPRR